MQAVLTGDIINSQEINPKLWYKALEDVVGKDFTDVSRWEIYRGDEFQYLIDDAKDALLIALKLKSRLKEIENLDVRISIGVGACDFVGESIRQSHGSAFVNSGRSFEKLKADKTNLVITTNDSHLNEDLGLILEWCLLTADNWTQTSAEIMYRFLSQPGLMQEEAAEALKITQSSVSQRLKRAQYDLVVKTIQYFSNKISQLKS